jgi:hypothetical protein
MSRSLGNVLRDETLRKYLELIGILYFLFLAMMCAVELVRNAPEVMLPSLICLAWSTDSI